MRSDSNVDPEHLKQSLCVNKILRILTRTPNCKKSTINIYKFHYYYFFYLKELQAGDKGDKQAAFGKC